MKTRRKLNIKKPSFSKAARRRNEPGVPRITNESVAEHREEVLNRARKFIYPLRHSRSRVVKLTVGIVIVAIVLFLGSCALELYKFQSTSSFMYGVTRVIPFPVARADGRFVSYESYLFELRHYMHYYQSQQNVNFKTKAGQRQLTSFKQRSLDTAINRAYVASLAKQQHVNVSSGDVTEQVELARQQNRLGASDKVFKSVLSEFWGWSVTDFRHELQLELRDQKVAASLDTATTQAAKGTYADLQNGADFAKLAEQVSQDQATAKNGGAYGFDITRTNHDLPPKVIDAVFKLNKGQHSGIINTGYSLEIVKVLSVKGDKRQAAHIAFNFKDISTYVQPLRQQHKPTTYIHVD